MVTVLDSFIGGEVRSSVVNLAKEVQDEGKKKRRKKRVPIDDEEQKQLEQHERDTLDLLLSSAEELGLSSSSPFSLSSPAYALNDKSVSVSLKAASWMEVITPIPGEEKVLKSHLDGSEASIQSFDIYGLRCPDSICLLYGLSSFRGQQLPFC